MNWLNASAFHATATLLSVTALYIPTTNNNRDGGALNYDNKLTTTLQTTKLQKLPHLLMMELFRPYITLCYPWNSCGTKLYPPNWLWLEPKKIFNDPSVALVIFVLRYWISNRMVFVRYCPVYFFYLYIVKWKYAKYCFGNVFIHLYICFIVIGLDCLCWNFFMAFWLCVISCLLIYIYGTTIICLYFRRMKNENCRQWWQQMWIKAVKLTLKISNWPLR